MTNYCDAFAALAFLPQVTCWMTKPLMIKTSPISVDGWIFSPIMVANNINEINGEANIRLLMRAVFWVNFKALNHSTNVTPISNKPTYVTAAQPLMEIDCQLAPSYQLNAIKTNDSVLVIFDKHASSE